tara:strand:- start:1352 stop:1999 length:648 start_codon:yes stop_codon:yes gene_type:complete
MIASTLLLTSALVVAQGNSNNNGNANSHGKNKNVGVGNASDGIMGSVITDKRIYYSGDALDIYLRFARGSELILGGSVDAYVVIFSPAENGNNEVDSALNNDPLTDAIVLPVSADASSENHKLFAMDTVNVESLPAGTYQLGLILTNPDGDPLNINDWHNGLLGLINIVGLTITDEAVDFDQDGDGQVDDDDDGDGFSDSDDSDESASDTTGTTP